MIMTTSDSGQNFIVQEEGERLTAYQDSVGIWTIGVGHTGWVDAKPVSRGMAISKDKSREILQADSGCNQGRARDCSGDCNQVKAHSRSKDCSTVIT